MLQYILTALLLIMGSVFGNPIVTEIYDLPGNGWIYTAPAGIANQMYPYVIANITAPAYLKMTDVLALGDRYIISINGTAVALTNLPNIDPTNTTTTLDANVAFAGPDTWSNIWLPLDVGIYNISFAWLDAEINNPGVAAVRIDYKYPQLLV